MTTNSIALICAMLFHFFGRTQSLNFINYSPLDGLASSEVHDIYQDDAGYMWFATDRGLTRYDGYEFKSFSLEDGLTNTVLFEFFPQEDGKIWCTTYDNSLFYFIPGANTFTPYKYNEELKECAGTDLCDKVYFDANGTLFYSFSYRGGVLKIDKSGSVTCPISSLEVLAKNAVIEKTPSGTYFTHFEQSDEASLWPEQMSIIEKYEKNDPNEHESAFHKNLVLINSDDSLRLYRNFEMIEITRVPSYRCVRVGFFDSLAWASYFSDGIRLFDQKLQLKHHFLDGETVTACFKDHEGGYWFSTVSSGFFYTQSLDVIHYSFGKESHIVNIARGEGSLIYANTFDGRLFRWNNDAFKLFRSSSRKGPMYFESYNDFRDSLALMYSDYKVINHQGEVLLRPRFYIKKFSDDRSQQPLLLAREKIAVLENDNSFSAYTISIKSLVDGCHMKEKNLLLGTREGLLVFNTENRALKQLEEDHFNYWITEVDRIDEDHFIAGTKGNGVLFISNEGISKVTVEHGLSSNIINEVYVENPNTFWVCTSFGLNRITYNFEGKPHIENFTMDDGLSTNEISDIEIYNGEAWVASKRGVDKIPVEHFAQAKKRERHPNFFLKLQCKSVNGKKRKKLNDLSHWENEITFQFSAITFRNNKNLEYRYRLKGLGLPWRTTKNRKITYEVLLPGTYTFEVQVGINGKWKGEIVRQQIVILPAFYTTWWFILIIVLFSIFIIYLFFRYRILSYNKFMFQELFRRLLKRFRWRDNSFVVPLQNGEVKINSNQVLYVSAHKNYIEIHRKSKSIVLRGKISEFVNLVPDPQEYLQINRSIVIRKDRVTKKSRTAVVINNQELKIGTTYKDVYDQLYL